MSKLARLLLPHVVPGIVGARRASYDRVFESLGQLEFITRDVQVGENSCTIKLQVLSEDPLNNLIAGEANRFFLASMISLERARQAQEKNAAWQVIEHYYAAYFAIHYLIRITGLSISNLDDSSIQSIGRCSYSNFPQDVPPKGLYLISYDPRTHVLELNKPGKKVGGSHVDAWRLWVKLLDKLIFASEKDIEEYASESLILGVHKGFVLRSTDKFSPPIIRGEINYQFSGGVWEFERESAKNIRLIQKSMIDSFDNTLDYKSTSEAFVGHNKIIIELARTIFTHSSNNYPNGICRSLRNKYSEYFSASI